MKANAFKKTKAALSLFLALAMVRPAVAEQHYAFISGTFSGEDYLEMARNVKNSSEISDIRRQILQNESLSKEEKVSLFQEVSDIQLEKIDAEARVQYATLYAEAGLSALVRWANLTFNKNPASAGAVDAFAQEILDGNVTSVVVEGMQTGDWSGLEQIAQSVGAGMVFGKLLSSGVLGQMRWVKNVADKVTGKLANLVKKTPILENVKRQISQIGTLQWEWCDELYSTLKPRLGEVQGEMAELYRKIAKAKTQAEKDAFGSTLAALEKEAAELKTQIARREAEIAGTANVIDRYENIYKDYVDSIGRKVDTLILGFKLSPDQNNISDWLTTFLQNYDEFILSTYFDTETELIVSAQMAIADMAFDMAEKEHRTRVAEIEREQDDGGPLVLHGSVSVDVYPDGNGEYGEAVNQNGDGVNGGIVRDRTNDGLRPGTEQDPVSHHGQYDGVDAKTQTVLDAIFDALGWSMDEKTTGNIIDVIIDAIKDGGTKLDQYEQKIGDMLPGDNAKEALGTLLDKVVNGFTDGIGQAIRDFGQAVAVDYSTGIVIDLGLAEGMPVLEIQMNLQALIADGYEAGASFVATLNQAVNGGCFGGGNSGQSISIGIQNGQVVVGVGGQQVPISKISPAGVWGTIKSKIQTIALQKLEQFAVKQLDSWINKNPTLQKWLGEIFGINGQSIVDGLKNIWGVLTGNGTLAEKFSKLAEMAQNALCDMAKHALKWGLEKLQGWLSDIAQKLIGQIMGWISDILGRIFAKFGISISTDFLKKIQDWLNAQAGKGVKKVVGILEKEGNTIIDKFRPNNSGSGGNKTVWGSGQQPATTP